jgi:hypothetical protein
MAPPAAMDSRSFESGPLPRANGISSIASPSLGSREELPIPMFFDIRAFFYKLL